MSQPVPIGDGSTSPSVHNVPTKARSGVPNIAKQLQAAAEFIIEGILGQVLIAFGGVSIFGVKPFAALAVLGKSIVDNANAAYANSVTAQTTADAANTKSDNIIDALVSGLTGQSSTGNDVANVGLALIKSVVDLPGEFINSVLAIFAGQQAQITAIQNNPGGPSTTDDFSAATLSGRTNVSGTMAISPRGPYLQTTAFAADYMGTTGTPRKPATNRCGTSITVDPNQRGACRAWFCGDAGMTNYAAVEVYSGLDGDAVRIVSGSSPTLTVIRSQVDVPKIAGTTVFDIKYDPTTNTFTAFRNLGDIGLFWIDSGNDVTHTTGKTLVGAVENCDDIDEDGFRGPAIRKQTFYDW